MQIFDTCATEEEAVAYIHPLIEILDQMRPGWPNAVDLELLDMIVSDPEPHGACLFAQLFGGWYEGIWAVRDFVKDHGLTVPDGDYISNSTAAVRGTVQHRAWERVIRERQAA